MSSSGRPVIKDLPRGKIELVCEIVAVAALVFAWAVTLHALPDLPERVPTHFDAFGRPDAWGRKGTVLVLPAILLILYALLTLLARVPHVYNYPVAITPENARTQYRLARIMLTEMKAAVSLAFAYLAWAVAAVARGAREDLGPWFLLALLALIAGLLAKYILTAHRATSS